MSKHRSFSLTLQQLTENYKDVEVEFQELKTQCEQYKSECLSQKEKCEKKTCIGCRELQHAIASKDNIIHLVASVLTRLNETRNFNILNEAFKILSGEEMSILTPPKEVDNVAVKEECSATFTQNIEDAAMRETPKKDESVSEIESTPTGRTSPIIKSKKSKTRTSIRSPRAIESGVIKKTSNSWPSPEKKFMKLSYNASPRTPRPSGKLRQSRLHLVRGDRQRSFVDLTRNEGLAAARMGGDETRLNISVKRECADNDTIMPSPTSDLVKPDFSEIFKANASKSSPVKFKRPSDVKIKTEDVTRLTLDSPNTSATVMEESINLLQPLRFANKQSRDKPRDTNITQDGNILSLSILQHMDKIDKDATRLNYSPSKRPLADNKNATNIPRSDADLTTTKYKREPGGGGSRENAVPKPSSSRRKTPEKQEDLYKEPTVRKKAEKLALPGWSCEECRIFYDELYSDNPAMLSRLMAECSKHRARRDPSRATTPPGYWQPRWDVPTDTDDFNRRNNA